MEYVQFNHAFLLKKIFNFSPDCDSFYIDNGHCAGEGFSHANWNKTLSMAVSRPTLDQVKNWLREEQFTWLSINPEYSYEYSPKFIGYTYSVAILDPDNNILQEFTPTRETGFALCWDNYYTAFHQAVDKALHMVMQKKADAIKKTIRD